MKKNENKEIAHDFLKLIGCGTLQVMRADILGNENRYVVDYHKLIRHIETFTGAILNKGESVRELTERVYGKRAYELLEKLSK